MKKFFLTIAIILLTSFQGFCSENIVPQYVSVGQTNTLGLYQAPSEIVLYKEPLETSNIVHSISWIGDKIFPESVKAEDLFIGLSTTITTGLHTNKRVNFF